MKQIALKISFVFFISIYSYGQIINVPADQPTIQSAINISVDGDTVLVADGTYFENINFKGKAITLASLFLIDGDEAHIDSTIINGSQPSHPDSGSVVFFITDENTTTVLYGFTITGGSGTKNNVGWYGAGGILVHGCGGNIQHNKIIGNTIKAYKAFGAGIVIDIPEYPTIIYRNTIANNILDISDGGGGGIFCYSDEDNEARASENIFIVENVIRDNSVYGTRIGGGIRIIIVNPLIKNNLIIRNSAYFGGGVSYKDFLSKGKGVSKFINNTIVSNYSHEFAGLHSYYTDNYPRSPKILNCIIWENISDNNSQISDDFIIEYSEIEGGYEGIGNIDLDPQFADTVKYYLSTNSPCIDAGIPYSTFNDVEDPNNPGTPLFPSLGSLRNDIGAYGGNPNMLDINTDVTETTFVQEIFKLSQNYPNPFNPSTSIIYEIPGQARNDNNNTVTLSGVEESAVTLKVFDILGREVVTLVNQKQNPGNYEVTWDASNKPSGVYFYRLTAGTSTGSATDFVETKKMILIR